MTASGAVRVGMSGQPDHGPLERFAAEAAAAGGAWVQVVAEAAPWPPTGTQTTPRGAAAHRNVAGCGPG